MNTMNTSNTRLTETTAEYSARLMRENEAFDAREERSRGIAAALMYCFTLLAVADAINAVVACM